MTDTQIALALLDDLAASHEVGRPDDIAEIRECFVALIVNLKYLRDQFDLTDFLHWCMWAWIVVGFLVIVPVSVMKVAP